uniref:Non-specific protein-tyrosine kinase n=1 Tax=Panagrellus redivivus TaxID=6233 RepID=A0A7E4V2J7_PANRE
MFFWETPSQLSLSYTPGSTRPLTVRNKKVICEHLSYNELNDNLKLCQFFHLERHEFYPVCLNPKSAALKCIDFLEDSRSKGYTDFISIVEYVLDLRVSVYGNHYIILYNKNSEVKSQTQKLLLRHPIHFTKLYSCVALTNYVNETQDTLDCLFHKISQNYLCNPILLGELVRPMNSISIVQLNKEANNLRAGYLAKELLGFIRQHLGLPPEYKTETVDDAANKIDNAIGKISMISLHLTMASSPSQIKTIMLNLNELLIEFVSCNYIYLHDAQNGREKISTHDLVLTTIHGLNRVCLKQANALSKGPVSFKIKICNVTTTENLTKQNEQVQVKTVQKLSDYFATSLTVSSSTCDVIVTNKKQKLCHASAILPTRGRTLAQPVSFAVCDQPITLTRRTQEGNAVVLLKQLTFDKCETTVTDVSLKPQNPRSSCITFPAKPRLTILVIGRSNENNSTLIERLICGNKTEKVAKNAVPVGIINYGSYDIKLVNIVPDTTPLDLSLHPTLHGFIFVFENEMTPVPFIAKKDLRNLLEMVHRSAARNCCIVNIFTQNASFKSTEASNQLLKFIDAFCKVHELKDRISHFCVDKSAVLNHQEHTPPDHASNIKYFIQGFILPVTNSPVTRNELKIVESLKKMGDILHRKQIQSDESIDRLLASIADRTMSDNALYFRKYLKTAVPLATNEWKTAVNWKIDADLLEIVREIGSYLKAEVSSALEKLKSKSIFDMMSDSGDQSTQVTGNINGIDEINKEPTLSTASQISNFVFTQANESNSQLAIRTSTALPSKNVLIVGSSALNKKLLNCVNCVRQHESFDDVVSNASMITFQDSDDYVMDYGTHTIRYIGRDELGTEEFDLHGCVIVVENSTSELSNSTDNHVRNTFSRLPRCAVENCCIVNTFTPTDTFGMNDAEQQMRELVTKFCDQHALTNRPSFICIDAVVIDTIHHHNVSENPNVYQSAYAASKRGIEQFLQTIQAAQPNTPGDLENSANWARLCDAFRSHRTCRDPEVLRLMATIAETCLTGLAIYCRKNKGDTLPLRDDEWPAALSYWNSKADDVASMLKKCIIE